MSCTYCVKNHKPSCDPELLSNGGCANFRADWEPDEEDNLGIIAETEEEIFETLGNAFKPNGFEPEINSI